MTRSWDDFSRAKGHSLDNLFNDPARKPKSYTNTSHSKGSKGSKYSFERCYHSHPPLKMPGSELTIFGGSCCDPEVKDADVYVGFDLGMRFTQRSFPWKKGTEFLFAINDMCAPNNPTEFIKLVDWVKKQMEAGQKVHVGCIGGHGRTGTFLAALVSKFGETDAIAYVRKNYCKKAVESSSQVAFLKEHFGIKEAGGSKTGGFGGSSKVYESKLPAISGGADVIECLKNHGSIWEEPVA